MTAAKVQQMKESMNLHFKQIYSLCEFILGVAQKESLLIATLLTLQRFLSWIPLGFIFETPLVSGLISKYFPINAYR